jgi:hypothetical protein
LFSILSGAQPVVPIFQNDPQMISHGRQVGDLPLYLRQLFLEQSPGLMAGCAAFVAHFQNPDQLG